MAEPVDGVQAVSVLYDLALVTGGEVTLEALLTKTLQRLLYHTGFPAGLVCTTLAGAAQASSRDVRIETAVGNYQLIRRVGQIMSVPAALVEPAPLLAEMPGSLEVFPARKPYRYFLRLPIPEFGMILLLNPEEPHSSLPLPDLFLPIMSHLATAVTLCQRIRDRTAQLEVANKELEAFAYSVSHDLRAPLRHIDGFLELLQSRIGAGLDEQSRHYMAAITDAARRMGDLIDDLLSFSRMGRNAMARQQVDLAVLVREVIGDLAPDAAGRNIRWQIGDLPEVTGDRSMLRMVLVNLISNALKFTRPRAEAQIEIGCLPGTGSEHEIFVRDNGVGFDMAYADRLFGVFHRLHRADEFEGTGIGLANVRRIISRHGGRAWAKGEMNQGATFYFSVPRSIQGR